MASNRRALNVPITTDTAGLKKGVREAEQEFDKLEGAAKRSGASLVGHIGSSGARAGVAFKQGIAPLAGIALAAGAVAGAALTKGVVQNLDIEEANTKLKVQLDLTKGESEKYGKLAGQLFASNYGDSLGEVNDALKNVVSNIDGLRSASSDRLKGITSDVIEVSKAFDQDLGGTTRAVGQLMRTGLADDAQEALNIITKGFQRGADKSGDFLDTLNEYGTQFRKLGIDGETATGLISQGLKAGARDGDLVADSLKEFSIRAVDGSKTTSEGFKTLGLDAEKMAEKIGKGGAPAAKGLDQVLDRLRKIKDPVKQSQTAVELFGTQAEDLGKALYALDPSKATDTLGKVGGAARKLNQEMGDTAKSKIQTFWRTLQAGGTGALSSITPKLGDAAQAATNFIKGMRDGSGAGGEFAARITTAIANVRQAISSWVNKNRGDIDSVVNAFKVVGTFAKQVFQETLLPIVKRTMHAIGPIFDGLYHTIRGVVRLISGLLSGNWEKAWSGAKEAVSGAFKAIKTNVVTQAGNVLEIIKDLGPKLVKGIVKGLVNMGKALSEALYEGIKAAAKALPGLAGGALKGIGKAITGAISSGFDALNPFGDGEGLMAPTSTFSGGNSLMGAKSTLGWVASAAGRFGLHTSSGKRAAGGRTSSGGISYHGSGDAVDEAGSPAGMMGFFRYMKSKYGPILRELIYTPGGVGVKDGQPYRYSGKVAAEHFDHVHVAFTGGAGDGVGRKPGTGDGIGDIRALWTRAGGSADAQNIAAAVAMAESSGNPQASNRNSDGSIDRGLWQINSVHGAMSTFDRLGNAKAAVNISGNGRNWNPWTVYKTGAYKRFLNASAGTGSAGSKAKAKGPSAGSIAAQNPGAPKIKNSAVYAADDVDNSAAEARKAADAFRQAQEQTGPRKGGGPTKGRSMQDADDRQAILDAAASEKESALAEAIKANTDAINAAAELQQKLLEEVAALKDEVKQQTEFANSVQATDNFQLKKSLADFVSGQIVGYGVAGRAFTPGTGVAYAY